VSPRTLEKHRIYGTGPNYSKVSGRVFYAIGDLTEWAKRGAKHSTSDPGKTTVPGAIPANTRATKLYHFRIRMIWQYRETSLWI
jgi:hypothetical protein